MQEFRRGDSPVIGRRDKEIGVAGEGGPVLHDAGFGGGERQGHRRRRHQRRRTSPSLAQALHHSLKQGERGRFSGHEGLQASSATQKEGQNHSKKLTCKLFFVSLSLLIKKGYFMFLFIVKKGG